MADVYRRQPHVRSAGRDVRGAVEPLVLWWDDEAPTESGVAAAAAAQAVRAARGGPPRDARAAVEQEGRALNAAHAEDAAIEITITRDEHVAVVEALDVLGDDTAFATIVAITEGDDAALAFGYQPLGIGLRAGARFAAASLT